MANRYDTTGFSEDQYEPGSSGTVLKNLLGIASREEIEIAETTKLWSAQEQLLAEIEQDQAFTAQDICAMHRRWLGPDLSLGRQLPTGQHQQRQLYLRHGAHYP